MGNTFNDFIEHKLNLRISYIAIVSHIFSSLIVWSALLKIRVLVDFSFLFLFLSQIRLIYRLIYFFETLIIHWFDLLLHFRKMGQNILFNLCICKFLLCWYWWYNWLLPLLIYFFCLRYRCSICSIWSLVISPVIMWNLLWKFFRFTVNNVINLIFLLWIFLLFWFLSFDHLFILIEKHSFFQVLMLYDFWLIKTSNIVVATFIYS